MSTLSAPVESKLITGEELLAKGDIGPCELIDGRIVSMSPTGEEHSAIEFVLGGALLGFVRERGLGRVLGGEVGIYTRRNPDRVRGADVAFISKARSSGTPRKGFLETAPELVVEIMSPENRWEDMQQKIEEYFAIGVDRVWIVEPDNRVVRVYRSISEMVRLGEEDVLRGEGQLDGFQVPVRALFSEI